MTRVCLEVVLVLLASAACGGAKPEPQGASGSAGGSDGASAAGGHSANQGAGLASLSAKPTGTKQLRDVDQSPKQFVIGRDDRPDHGVGGYSVQVDGQRLWPPRGDGCPALVQCCAELSAEKDVMGLVCQLAIGRDGDCPSATRTVSAIAREQDVVIPAACVH